SSTTIVGNVIEGEPAAQAGLRPGDVVLAVNDQPTADWDTLATALRSRTERPFALTVVREGVRHAVAVTPSGKPQVSSASLRTPESIMGLQRAGHYELVGLGAALHLGAQETASLVQLMLRGMALVMSGRTPLQEGLAPAGSPLKLPQRFGIQQLLYVFSGLG